MPHFATHAGFALLFRKQIGHRRSKPTKTTTQHQAPASMDQCTTSMMNKRGGVADVIDEHRNRTAILFLRAKRNKFKDVYDGFALVLGLCSIYNFV